MEVASSTRISGTSQSTSKKKFKPTSFLTAIFDFQELLNTLVHSHESSRLVDFDVLAHVELALLLYFDVQETEGVETSVPVALDATVETVWSPFVLEKDNADTEIFGE